MGKYGLYVRHLTVTGAPSNDDSLSIVNRKQEISKDVSLIIDGVLLGACLWICYLLRSSGIIRLDVLSEIPSFSHAYWMLALIIPLTPLLLDLQGFYDNPLSQRMEELLIKITKAGFWLVLLLSICSIFGRLEVPSRSVLLLFILLAPLFLLVRVALTRNLLIYRYKSGTIGERSVIIGTVADSEDFLRNLTPEERLELQITQRFDIEKMDSSTIRKNLRQHSVGRVIFVTPDSPRNEDLPSSCETEGLDVWILSPTIKGILGNPMVQSSGKNRVLVFRNTPGDFWHRLAKRTVDIVGASLVLILLSPLCMVIAIAIKLTSPGPIIFRQVRNGKRGRRFTILKFRSMVENAPELHATLDQHNEMQGPVFKFSMDPRVTPIGGFLRRNSLDEIPQLVNVLRGEMSLVGPRPLPDYETERIEKSTHRRRLSVKPGITCLWQIRGRSSISSFEDWVQLDIEYIENATLLLDFWILIRTIPAVIFRQGAH